MMPVPPHFAEMCTSALRRNIVVARIRIHDDDASCAAVARLTHDHEALADQRQLWRMRDAPRASLGRMLAAVGGIGIAISQMVDTCARRWWRPADCSLGSRPPMPARGDDRQTHIAGVASTHARAWCVSHAGDILRVGDPG
jgi:hypothetical protein